MTHNPNNTADPTPGQARPSKPNPLQVIPANIPIEITTLEQWVCWRYSWDEDAEKFTKCPLNPRTGNLASSTDPKTWTTFAFAYQRYLDSQSESWRFDGIGLVLTDKNNIVGFDLDHCRNPETGDIEQLARDIIQGLPTYWEISTSGTGLRGFAFGRKPGSRCRSGDFEVYQHSRYLVITGHHMEGTPTSIAAVQDGIDACYAQIFPPKDTYAPGTYTNGTHLEYEDHLILDAARRARNGADFMDLFDEGNRQRHLHDDGSPDYSRSDAALCRLLAFYTKSEEQMDRLFRVSACNRPKWESRADYRQWTIDLAIQSTPDQWSGPSASRNGQPHDSAGDECNASSISDQQDVGPPLTLAAVVEVFQKWLHMPHLHGALYVLLGTYAANRMSGDPLWLMLVGGSGWGKTELLMSIIRLPHVHLASTLTEASLLSGTSRREKGKDSTGGILMKIGEFGYLLCKDFTSILSMNREASTAMLAALREIFDGNWTRHVGVDGGRTLGWKGKVAVIAGCTGAIDRFHAVVGALGERFVSFRLKDLDATLQGTQALQLVGQEAAMRKELSESVSRLFAGVTLPEKAIPLDRAQNQHSCHQPQTRTSRSIRAPLTLSSLQPDSGRQYAD